MTDSDLPYIDGGFACCLADPPWSFKSYSGRTGTPHRGAHDHYPTTSTDDLKRIPVGDILAKDAALFMWVVDSHFPDALDLGRAWGCNFKTCAFVWVKAKESFSPRPSMGYWSRKGSEQIWLFTRGKPSRLSKGVEQMIYCQRGPHSAKPEEQYRRIEALVGGPRIELFSRTTQPGWRSWGNEVGKRDGQLL